MDVLDIWHESRLLLGGLLLLAVFVYAIFRSSPEIKTETLIRSDVKPVLPPTTQIRQGPKRIQGGKKITKQLQYSEQASPHIALQPLVFFSSLTGTTEARAKEVSDSISQISQPKDAGSILKPEIHDLSYIDYDDYFVSAPQAPADAPNTRYFYIILIPTYNIDTVLSNFLDHLRETHHDFRVDTGALSGLLGFAVFGFGDREGWPTEEEGFCSQAKEVDKWMAKLTDRKRAYPLAMADVKGNAAGTLKDWQDGVQEVLQNLAAGKGLGEGVTGSGDALESEDEELEDEFEEEPEFSAKASRILKRKKTASTSLDDLEDIGLKAMSRRNAAGEGAPIPVDFTTTVKIAKKQKPQPVIKPMVPTTSPTYTSLTKQGYSIIGSHSGVKICRWTKSALRGRGSCYKRSFYGIASHLCMEATPSLSCSNKCVFCWRHGTNPVGTTWRWEIDPPEMILNGALEAHVKKIKMMRGVPGVRADRFADAMRVRHCALSLVGEPIFYPRINEFLKLLHTKRISSFLVCNAQHPQQLQDLDHVTQLYVSIDASNKESLRKVDRPLHRDFWERFQSCLDILREKRFRQRTVFRLTLVKGFNLEDEVEGYADLVAKALPCFIEVKGVTYCGTSSSSAAGLTMQNVPFWSEVGEFVLALNKALERRGLEYGIAAEHAHSCCALLGSNRFFKDGRWHTLIDYQKFFDCLESSEEFGPEDYIGEPTPEWAAWGMGGFDPLDERVDRKGRPKAIVAG